MPLVRTIFLGGISLDRETMFLTPKGKKADLLYDLNNWFFDYLYAHDYPIKQLPPLDDWKQSTEDVSHWSIAFPDPEWNVWIRSEIIEFK